MDKFKVTLFIFLSLAMLLCSSCIYATDVNENATDTDNPQIDDVAINTHYLQADKIATDAPTVENTNDKGSFDEFDNIIQNLKPGEVYTIDKDYCFNDVDTTGRCISISTDNITINGNGHYFDGNNNAVTFMITGNNVSILDLDIRNCQGYGQTMTITIDGKPSTVYLTTRSPVYWEGASGTMMNCYLIENSALNGGALTWIGENGFINNTVFINNTANGAGGAIYLNGENTTITNTMFINSTSKLLNEAIYLDRKQNSFNFNKIIYDKEFCINGSKIGVDVDNLCKSYFVQFGGEMIDIIPIIYSSIFCIKPLDNQTYYYGQFSNETHTFTLTLIKNFDEYGIAYENDYVIQANSMDAIFAGLVSDFYTVNIKVIKTVGVMNTKEQQAVYNSSKDNDILKTPVGNIITNDMVNIHNFKAITYILNVNYRENGYVSGIFGHWDENINYDIIVLNGNGAMIQGSYQKDEEYHWIENTKNKTYVINDLKLEGFNTAVINLYGTCIFNNVRFQYNKMDYFFDSDNGGAIINAGIIYCNNCTFRDNYAKNGGAIFSQGLLILENCTFENNKGYGIGNDVLNVDQGTVILNGNNTPINPITNVESISSVKIGIISFICTVAVIGITFLSTAIAFFASGANPVVAACVGITVGIAIGGLFGAIGGYAIASNLYNLDYNRKATFISFFTSMVTAGIGAALTATGVFYKITPADELYYEESVYEESVYEEENVVHGRLIDITQNREGVGMQGDEEIIYLDFNQRPQIDVQGGQNVRVIFGE